MITFEDYIEQDVNNSEEQTSEYEDHSDYYSDSWTDSIA